MKNAITIKKTLITLAVFASFATTPLVRGMEREFAGVPVEFQPTLSAQTSHFLITITPSMSVGELKQKIKQEQNIPIEQYRIVFAGKTLNDETVLQNLGGSTPLGQLNLKFNILPKLVQPITLQLADGSSRTLNLDATTSNALSKKIEEETGIPVNKQSVIVMVKKAE